MRIVEIRQLRGALEKRNEPPARLNQTTQTTPTSQQEVEDTSMSGSSLIAGSRKRVSDHGTDRGIVESPPSISLTYEVCKKKCIP